LSFPGIVQRRQGYQVFLAEKEDLPNDVL